MHELRCFLARGLNFNRGPSGVHLRRRRPTCQPCIRQCACAQSAAHDPRNQQGPPADKNNGQESTHHLADVEDAIGLNGVEGQPLPLAIVDNACPPVCINSSRIHGPVCLLNCLQFGGSHAFGDVDLFEERASHTEVVEKRIGIRRYVDFRDGYE